MRDRTGNLILFLILTVINWVDGGFVGVWFLPM
jgi:hypothetical protein